MLLYISIRKAIANRSPNRVGLEIISFVCLTVALLIAVGLSDIYGFRAAVFPYITHYRSDLVSGHLFFKTFIF